MDERALFEDKLKVSSSKSQTDPSKFTVTVEWTSPATVSNKQFMFCLYCYRREMNKNYSDYLYVETGKREYIFSLVAPRGYYDVRVVRNSGSYPEVYRLSKIFVGTPEDQAFEIVAEPQEGMLLVSFNRPAEQDDFIGLFDTDTLSMKNEYTVGLPYTPVGECVMARFFPVDKNKIRPEKTYEIRYFRADSRVAYGWTSFDFAQIPFCFSNPITFPAEFFS